MRILITGAGRAIGAATAGELAARGHHVVATARDVTLLADLDVAERLALDVTDERSVARALAAAGELDAVVNNAAVNATGPLESFPLDELAQMFDTNALGAVRVVQPLLAAWRERGSGVIVNVSSVAGKVAAPLDGPYAATKFALEALTEALYVELAHFGIRVLLVEPGFIAPGMKAAPHHRGPEAYDELWDQLEGTDAKLGPGGRPGPELVARAIADALEDPASPLRLEVGADAAMVLGARRQLDDAAFEAALRQVVGLTW